MGIRLALLGSVNDEILDLEELSGKLGVFLLEHFPEALKERYKSNFSGEEKPHQLLSKIADARACLTKGGEPDYKKAASFLLDDFRSGRLGKITLEFPEEGEYDKSIS